MTVWIKEWLSLLLSRPHLCLLSLWGGQQEFPSINQKPMPGSTIADLLTSPNAEGSVEIIQIKPGEKKKQQKKRDKPPLHVIDVRELISSLLVGENGCETTA